MHTSGEGEVRAVFIPYCPAHESIMYCKSVYPYALMVGSALSNWTISGRCESLSSIFLAESWICTRRSHFKSKPPNCRHPKTCVINSTGSPWLCGLFQDCNTGRNHCWAARLNGSPWWVWRQCIIWVACGPKSLSFKSVRLTMAHNVAIMAALM